MDRIKKTYSFDDILLSPQYSEIESRRDLDIESYLGTLCLSIPIISSPMDTVTEIDMCIGMHHAGGLGVIHRYNSIDDQSEMVRVASQVGNTGASIGVSGDYLERARALYDAGARVLCVDIAHGHHSMMRHALKVLRNTFGTSIHIMAGNVATLEGFNDLSDWGADSIRVGIGGGSICSTRVQTGHGVPTFQSVLDCSYSDRGAFLIADGGIRSSGDIVKALAVGADFVMLGSMLAGTSEAPCAEVIVGGERYKTYRGMASKDAQINWRGHTASVEGVSSMVPSKGPVSQVLQEIETGIRSGLSYSGATSIVDLQSKAQLIIQTSSGAVESSTHINRKIQNGRTVLCD